MCPPSLLSPLFSEKILYLHLTCHISHWHHGYCFGFYKVKDCALFVFKFSSLSRVHAGHKVSLLSWMPVSHSNHACTTEGNFIFNATSGFHQRPNPSAFPCWLGLACTQSYRPPEAPEEATWASGCSYLWASSCPVLPAHSPWLVEVSRRPLLSSPPWPSHVDILAA